MAFQMATDGRTVTHVQRRKSPLRGKDRKGIQAYDLLFQTTDPIEKEKMSPRTEKPRVLIETIKIVGEDIMTAQDSALYEFLLANARHEGIEKDSYEVSVSAMRKYLDIEHNARVAECLERITRTVVRYDFRDEETRTYGAMPLILAEISEDLKSGASTLTYAIPGAIRHVVLAAKQYAMLEINVFAKFKCRYTSRLYQRLALRAGMDEELRKPWQVAPLKLAVELGFPLEKDGTVHFTSFIRRCIEPALAEIKEHIGRFKVSMKMVNAKATGRGRPRVEAIVFKVSSVEKRPEEHQAARLSKAGLNFVRMNDPVHANGEMPSSLIVGRAVTMTGLDEFTLLKGWKAALDKAKADPKGEVCEGLESWFVLSTLAKHGVGTAFYIWADAANRAGEIDTTRKLPIESRKPTFSGPNSAEIKIPAAAVAAGGPMKEILFPIDPSVDYDSIKSLVIPRITSAMQCGDEEVSIAIRYWDADGTRVENVGKFYIEDEGLEWLMKGIGRYLDGELEITR